MLIFVTALAAEARPLIRFYKLKLVLDNSFCQVFQKDQIFLLVTGVGKMACNAACSFFQGAFPQKNSVWINVGIAGHKDLAIGTGVWAGKVLDTSSNNVFYPTFLQKKIKAIHNICTVDFPEKEFSTSNVYEMECVAFMFCALKTSTLELVHAFKVISDNVNEKIAFRSPEIEQIISPHVEEINQMANKLLEIRKQIHIEYSLTEFTFFDRFHFTQTEKHKLFRILQKYRSLQIDPLQNSHFANLTKGSDVLEILENKLQPIRLSI